MTRRILATALVSAASFAAVLGVPATADNPTPTATASTVPPAVETAPPAASPADVPTQTPTEAPTQPPAQDTAAAAPTETATDAPPVETPFPSPVDTTIPTVPPVATATADATAAATATATATETARRTRAANRSAGRNGQARACTAKGTGKLSTSTSASGCVEVKAPKTYTPPVHVPKLTNRDGSPASSNPSYALSVPGPAKIGVPNFFIDKFRIPPFLLPIYQAAGMQYGIRWEILAGINEIETDYGRNLNVSSAGALGWMQFMPATWKTYGVDANQDGVKDPFNPVDAIFAAARYLKAAGGDKDLRRGIFAYNHADWYVDSVLMRAQVIGGIPGDLIGSLTGLTQGRFPVRAKATYAGALKKADRRRKGANAAVVVESQANRRNIEIYARAGSPVIAVNDGKVTRIGASKRLGRYITVQDVYGNSYTYAQLKTLAKLYPSPKPRTKKQSATGSLRRGVKTAAPSKSETESGADVKAAEKVTAAATTAKTAALAAKVRLFAHPDRKNARVAGGDSQLASGNTASDSAPLGLDPKDFVAKRLVKGARVLGGTTLGRIGKTGAQAPHLLFEIRPAGRGAPRIDPKPILDGWKLLESTEVYRAKGKNALFGADSNEPSIGQIMLMSKETLTRRVLEDPRIEIYGCGRADIRSGAIDRRVLATLAFLASSGLKPAVSSLQCGHGQMTSSGNVSEHTTGTAVDIAQINGIPIYGHQGPGSIADLTIQRLLTLQGTMKPHQIISLMTFDGADNTLAMADHADHIHIGWRPLYGENKAAARQIDAILKPKQWIKLIDRLGQIDNPTVAAAPSKYAVKVKPASD